MTWWWLSFADPNRPDGQQLLGLAVVHAHTAEEALNVARACDAGPADECGVMVLQMPPCIGPPPPCYTHRLLRKDEACAMQALWTPDQPGVATLGALADAGNPAAIELVSGELTS